MSHSPTLVYLAERARAPRVVEAEPNEPDDVQKRLELAVGVHRDRDFFGLLSMLLWMTAFICLGAFSHQQGPMSSAGVTTLAITVGLAILCTIASWTSSRAAQERRATAVSQELLWSTTQPFEVTGYRAWLAADASILTVTLRAEIDTSLVADAARAIDPTIEAEIIDGATFSIAVPSRTTTLEDGRFGNIALLKQLFGRLLLPLHHEVGIERVTMGQR